MLSDNDIRERLDVKVILKKFPKSGQKQVLLVEHNIYGKVVLKIVEGNAERVMREIQIITENKFINVPLLLEMKPYEINDNNGIYIFEEFIDGLTLRKIISLGKLSLPEAMGLMESILEVIVQMEEQRVVHRDIKPDNIIKCKNGEWHLIDFGIARGLDLSSLTYTEVKIGPHTPGYGAPELFQYSKRDIDSRADLFSLGVVLFEAVTGKHPFVKGDELDVNEIWYRAQTVIAENVIIDGDRDMQFMGLIQTFMQKHISRRPRNAAKAREWFLSVKKHIEEGDV